LDSLYNSFYALAWFIFIFSNSLEEFTPEEKHHVGALNEGLKLRELQKDYGFGSWENV
jgi:hypothetical protein